MKNPMLVLATLIALFAVPASAQQGPAGVPGAPLIGATIAPPPAPPPATQKTQTGKRVAVCSKAKNVEQCKVRHEARKQARAACRDKKETERQQCIRDTLAQGK